MRTAKINLPVSTRRVYTREPLNKSAAADSGSFAPTFRFENLEIHKVFLRFSNLILQQNLSPTALADFFRASLEFDKKLS